MIASDTSMRPGISADYAPMPSQTAASGSCIGIIASAPELDAVTKPTAERFSSFPDALNAYGNSPLTTLIRAVFDNAACDVIAIRVNDGDAAQYQAALELLASHPAVGGIVGGNPDPELSLYAAELLRDSSRSNGGKLYFTGCTSMEHAAATAERINCERVILTAPALFHEEQTEGGTDVSAALVAAVTARQESPSSNLFGEEILGDYTLPSPVAEAQINELLRRGVTLLEPGVLCPCIVRGVTTRTRNEENIADYTLRNISSPRTIDHVTQMLKTALDRRMQTSGMSLSSLSSLVEWELIQLTESGLISAYEKPVLVLDELDPSICDITVSFTIRQGVAQISLHLRYE